MLFFIQGSNFQHDFSVIFWGLARIFGLELEFRPKIWAGPSFSPKNRAGPTARWPAGQAFVQPESPRAGKFPARPKPRREDCIDLDKLLMYINMIFQKQIWPNFFLQVDIAVRYWFVEFEVFLCKNWASRSWRNSARTAILLLPAPNSPNF